MNKLNILLSFVIIFISFFSVEALVDNSKIIVIDPGHGGMDGGASIGDIYESNLVLEISKKMQEVFEKEGYYVILTREDRGALSGDEFIKKVDMQKRVNIINQSNATLAISIHLNKFSIEKYRGSQVFYSDNNINNSLLAEVIQNNLSYYLGNTDRKIVNRNNIYLLNHVTIPCCLIECGFMSNHEELELLKNEDYQYKLAYAVLIGINKFLGKNE